MQTRPEILRRDSYLDSEVENYGFQEFPSSVRCLSTPDS